MTVLLSSAQVKQRIAQVACEHFSKQDTLALGTGSTVEAMIDAMVALDKIPTKIIVSSKRSMRYCQQHGIKHAVYIDQALYADVYFDGADEVDPDWVCLKGAGGAMTGERLCARIAKKFVLLVEKRKLVKKLGEGMPLPVEVIPWARASFAQYIYGLGGEAVWREGVLSDSANPIMDCQRLSFNEPFRLAQQISMFPGVVAHGLFIDCQIHASIIGSDNGECSYQVINASC